MKLAIGLVALGLSFVAIAGESQTINYDGTQSSYQLTLRGEKTHTEYTSEERPWTCYKEGIVGYETVCAGGPFPVGLPGSFPGGLHDPRYRYPIGMYPGYGTCRRAPIYRSVPYECTRTIKTGTQVKDYDVVANVNLNIAKNTVARVNENFTLSLKGDKVEIANSSKKYIVELVENKADATMSGSVKTVESTLNVEMTEAAPVVSSLEIEELSVEDGVLSVALGNKIQPAAVVLSVQVTKKKLGADKLVIERELKASEVNMRSDINGIKARINVESLGVKLANGKYAITVKAALKPRGTLLNKAELGDVEASRTLIYSVR